jgi:dienelactone hydrolase
MRNWQSVSPRQRVLDAVAAYLWLSRKPYVKNDKIGLIGWSWGGASALFAQKLARRLSLPNGGFKATIAFYPNLKYAIDTPQWTRSGPIEKPTLILYGKSDTLESKESYDSLLSAGYSADIRVLGFKGAYKKFDELGGYREKYHPSIGNFPKAFQKEAFETSIKEIKRFLSQNLQ